MEDVRSTGGCIEPEEIMVCFITFRTRLSQANALFMFIYV